MKQSKFDIFWKKIIHKISENFNLFIFSSKTFSCHHFLVLFSCSKTIRGPQPIFLFSNQNLFSRAFGHVFSSFEEIAEKTKTRGREMWSWSLAWRRNKETLLRKYWTQPLAVTNQKLQIRAQRRSRTSLFCLICLSPSPFFAFFRKDLEREERMEIISIKFLTRNFASRF